MLQPPGISVDTILNLLWFGICVSGLAFLSLAEYKRSGRQASHGRLRRLAAFLTITLALFPSVSVTDDEASLWLLRHATSRGGMGVPVEEKERTEQSLARLFDGMNELQVQAIWTLAIGLCFFVLIQRSTRSRLEGFLVSRSCRAPPLCA